MNNGNALMNNAFGWAKIAWGTVTIVLLAPLVGLFQKRRKKKMRWYEKMAEGMRLMQEACSENETWDKCWGCPFDSICEKLMDAARAESVKNNDIALDEYIPAGWGKEEEK